MNLRFLFTLIATLLALTNSRPSTSAATVAEPMGTDPTITGIILEGSNVVVSAHVPAGPTKIVLQSSRRLGTGAWEPRAVVRVDGRGGEVVFRVTRSPDLEIVRVRADASEPLPSSFFKGTNVFPGA